MPGLRLGLRISTLPLLAGLPRGPAGPPEPKTHRAALLLLPGSQGGPGGPGPAYRAACPPAVQLWAVAAEWRVGGGCPCYACSWGAVGGRWVGSSAGLESSLGLPPVSPLSTPRAPQCLDPLPAVCMEVVQTLRHLPGPGRGGPAAPGLSVDTVYFPPLDVRLCLF